MKKNFEIVLKKYMWLCDFSQKELSEKAKIPLPTIKKYLSGNLIPREKNLKKICENLELSEIVLTTFDLSDYQGIINALSYLDRNINDWSEEMYEILEKLEFEKRPKYFEFEEISDIEELSKEEKLKDLFKECGYIFFKETENEVFFKDLKDNGIIKITNFENIKGDIYNFVDFLFFKSKKENEENPPANEEDSE